MIRPIDKVKGLKKFTLEFPTSDLLKMFGLPSLDHDLEPPDWDFNLTDNIDLTVSKDEEGDLVDARGKKLTPETVLDIKQAISDATVSGTAAEFSRRILHALERVLETFSDYRYEYFYLTDEGERSTSGVAKGVLSVDAKFDTTKLVVADDLVHIIHNCLVGYGMFNATDDFEGVNLRDFVKSRFSHLRHHWEIYGDRMPQPDLDRVDEFDRAYFKTLLHLVETNKLQGGPYALTYKSRKR